MPVTLGVAPAITATLACALAATSLMPLGVSAQDSTRVELAPVRVSVTRDAARPALELPFALSRVDVEASRAMTRRANLTELLFAVPGLTTFTRYNPTQDPRLSVRGFGARSAFGIRGVRVLRDGIPLTLADGQTAIDFLDLETVGAAEVMRGSAGALYGNSSGGVVDFRTPDPPASGYRAELHGFSTGDAWRGSLFGAAATPLGRWQATVTRNEGTGPRDYAEFENTSVFAFGRFSLGGVPLEAQVTHYDAPRAQNPGALTAAELEANPDLADSVNIRRRASKTVRQTLVALTARRDGERRGWSASVFGGTRSLDNPQSFAIVAFDRVSLGASLRGQIEAARRVRLSAGADVLSQDDDRWNWSNCAGLAGTQRDPVTCPTSADKGVATVDQREKVSSLGGFARAEVPLGSAVDVTASLRLDQTRFSVTNHFDPASGTPSRTLGDVTPMAGINWRVGTLASVYANYAESFETPTTTELANQPDGSGGLNRELKPQHGRSYEAGTKGVLGSRLRYDVAAFYIATTDELIPFEVPGSNGRRFFRNAGETSRAGVEGGLGADVGVFSLGGSWTALRYRYEDFVVAGTSYDGKRVPGVPSLTVGAYVNARAPWGLAAVELQHAARTPADDANATYAKAYSVVNVRTGFRWGERFGAEPAIGIDNLFDQHYAANVVTNAARTRFFEPGPGRTFYVSVRLRTGTKG